MSEALRSPIPVETVATNAYPLVTGGRFSKELVVEDELVGVLSVDDPSLPTEVAWSPVWPTEGDPTAPNYAFWQRWVARILAEHARKNTPLPEAVEDVTQTFEYDEWQAPQPIGE